MELHENSIETCQHCSYTTRHPKNMKVHVRKYHLHQFDSVCEICGASFVYKYLLRQHSIKEHGEVGSFS